MGVLADLVPRCQPSFYGLGYNRRATAGATWLWRLQLTNNAGVGINLTGVTGVCHVVDDGVVLISLDVSGDANGLLSVGKDESATAALASAGPVYATWSLTLNDGTDTIQVWAVDESHLTIGEDA